MNKPNVVIIMADGWRRQAVGCMNADPVATPHVDELVRTGLLCTGAISNHPMCTPARAAFLTGRYAQKLGMEYNWQRLPVEEPCFSSVAAAHGYDTALIGKWHLDDYEPTDQHGDHWTTLTPPGPRRMGFRYWHCNGCCHAHWQLQYNTNNDDLVVGTGWQPDYETDIACAYIRNDHDERPADAPFLMWLNYSTPHNECGGRFNPELTDSKQYYAPLGYENQYRQDQPLSLINSDTDNDAYQRWAPGYYGMVSSLDECIGRLMRTLEDQGLAENTIVVVTSDHGEMLATHDRWMKGIYYEESIGVPFIMRWPQVIPGGQTHTDQFGLVDWMPTLLDLMGLPVPPGRDGVSQKDAWLYGKTLPDRVHLLSHNTGAPPPHRTRYEFPLEQGMYWRGLRSERYTYACVDQRNDHWYGDQRWHLAAHATCVLFDNEADPHQQQPIYRGQGYDEIIDQLHRQLVGMLDDIGDNFLTEYWQPERHSA